MTIDCPDELFDKMKKNCAKHIKVCKEINVSFLPLEAQVSVSGDSFSLLWLSLVLIMTVCVCCMGHLCRCSAVITKRPSRASTIRTVRTEIRPWRG